MRIEAAALRPLPARRTTDFTEVVARVTRTGGFMVHSIFYSAPSQLIQLDPHSCWMLTRSMETLALRMQRAAESGRKVAGWLAGNEILPCAVLHPEFGEERGFADIYARQCTGRAPPSPSWWRMTGRSPFAS